MDIAKIISRLKGVGGIFEVYHVEQFKCYRKKPDGSVEEVRVMIQDAGPSNGSRYTCVVTAESGNQASGNPADCPETAIAITHWQRLDKAT